METKNLLQSKVLWFNILSILSILLADIMGTPEMKAVLGSHASTIMIVGALINAILRQYTTVPLRTNVPK